MDHNANHRQPSKTRQAGPLPNRLRHHGDILLILVLFVAFRLMALVVFRPGGYLGEMGDLGYYRLLLGFANQGFLPVVDFWMEYPPIFPWLMLGIYRLSLLIPPWSVPGTWFYLLLGTVLTIAAAGNLLLLYNLARRLVDQKQAVRLSWIYAVLLVPLLTIFIGFDGLALLALLWAVLLTLDRRPVASGIATGLGFMTKLVPIAAAPAALMHLPRLGSRAKYVAALALTILLIALPFLIAGPDYLAESLISPVKRSTWETPWALIDGYFSFGVAGGPDRFDPAQSGAAQHPTRLPWLAITGGFIVFYLYIWMRAGPRLSGGDNERTTGRRVVAFVALTQNLLTLYFKGYSPQFLVMLLPFLLLLLPVWRGVLYALLLSAINLVEYPIYFLVLPDAHWLLTGTVLLRTLVLVVVSFEYAGQVYGWRASRRWWRWIAAGVTGVVVLAGIVGAVAGFDVYWQQRYQANDHRRAMETLDTVTGPGATVVVDDQAVYEAIYPFLHRRFEIRDVEVASHLPPWEPRLTAVAEESTGDLWIYAPGTSPFHNWAAERYAPLASFEFDGHLLTGWDVE